MKYVDISTYFFALLPLVVFGRGLISGAHDKPGCHDYLDNMDMAGLLKVFLRTTEIPIMAAMPVVAESDSDLIGNWKSMFHT